MFPKFTLIDQIDIFGRTIGPIDIYSYGIFLALAFLSGLALFLRDGKREGLKAEDQLDLMIYIILFSIIGARIFYVILCFGDYSGHPLSALKIYEGGLSFHGGAMGGILAIVYYSWRKKYAFWRLADTAIRPLIIGSAIARIGCFLNGCCYGHPWHGPWAVVFPSLHDGIPRHPTQFYDLGLHLVLFAVITYLYRFKRRHGDISAFYLMGFAILRFTVEFFRIGATAREFALGLTEAQWGSFAIFAVGLFLYMRNPIPAKESPEEKNADNGGNRKNRKKRRNPK